MEVQDSTLKISGRLVRKHADAKEKETDSHAGDTAPYLHRGIGVQDFQQQFQLDEFMEISAAKLANGLLTIHLVRKTPPQQKPRQIAIS